MRIQGVGDGYGLIAIVHESREGSSAFVFDMMEPERPKGRPKHFAGRCVNRSGEITMDIAWLVLHALIAISIMVLTMQITARLISTQRARTFSKYEDQSQSEIARDFPLPDAVPSRVTETLRSLGQLVATAHNEAIYAQNRYFSTVVRSAVCLFLALLALALTASPLRQCHPTAVVLAWLDALSISLVLGLFLQGHAANRQWITLRAGAELLRQYQFLTVVFPTATSHPPAHDLTSRFLEETELIKKQVQGDSFKDIALRIERFWSDRESLIANSVLTDADISADALLPYLHRRLRRQLGWFKDSQERLKGAELRRKRWLLMLYWMAAVLAWIKLVETIGADHLPASGDICIGFWAGIGGLFSWPPAGIPESLTQALLPTLLMVTGLSAVMTAFYVNQNLRSLLHRYHTQERRISGCFQSLEGRSKICVSLVT